MASADGEEKNTGGVRKWAWVVGGVCAATVGFLVWGPKRVKPVQDLAHRLEEAWEEHDDGQDPEI